MDLHSGFPFWLIKNGLLADFPALQSDLLKEEVVIIGSGISGALVAHELCSAGFHCTMVDKRLLSGGSTWASTAQLNYEIDCSMYQLAHKYNEHFARAVYETSLATVHRMKEIARQVNLQDQVQAKPSLYLASSKKGLKEIDQEYHMRRRHNIPVELLNEADLKQEYKINKAGALFHNHALQVDSYRITVGLIQHHVQRGWLNVYTRTGIKSLQANTNGVTLVTDNERTIKARFVVCAPGYESAQFLPKKVMDLHSTYALVTQPLPEHDFWKDRCLIWETARPYIYLRTTTDHRIMMGGEDVSFKNEIARDRLMEKKTRILLRKCNELFPHIQVQADFYWCGTFGETEDALPYIGKYPGIDNVYFALGYGGNGTSYSLIAAEMICNELLGKPDQRAALFSFKR